MKRIFDIICSAVGLLVLSPLLLVAAVWVAVDSPGGVFYRQTRVGRWGKDFALLKFRSMRPGADRAGLITVGGRDSRVTRSGYWLRRYKIDELPQLWNVLRGDMSLVGPRPEVRKYVDMYTPEQRHVLDVRPGITSEASIRYRDENDILARAADPEAAYINQVMPDKLAIDLEYARRASLCYDIKLIVRTLRAL